MLFFDALRLSQVQQKDGYAVLRPLTFVVL